MKTLFILLAFFLPSLCAAGQGMGPGPGVGAFGSAPPYLVDAADFDGTNDSMARGAALTGIADSKSGILSFWIRIDSGDGVLQRVVHATGNQVRVRKETTNTLTIAARNAGGTDILSLATVGTLTAGTTWYHVLVAWDLATAGARFIYINDAADLSVITFTNDTIAYAAATDWTISGFGGANLINGCVAEFYFAPGQYLDISNTTNRRKFISATGKPVSLGADGSTPTGTAPIMYQRVADGAAASTFATNLGTGGNSSITGTLDVCSTSPSD